LSNNESYKDFIFLIILNTILYTSFSVCILIPIPLLLTSHCAVIGFHPRVLHKHRYATLTKKNRLWLGDHAYVIEATTCA